MSAVLTTFPPQPYPPSFHFVQPQIGALVIPSAASDSAVMPGWSGTASIYYNTTNNTIRVWTGTAWRTIATTTP
jgi:hypothetical protein